MSAAFAVSVAVSSGTFFLADSAAQLAERCSKGASNRDTGIQAGRDIYELTSDYSLARALRYAFVGGLVMAPMFHVWYQIIERIFPGRRLWYQKLLLESCTIAPVYLACNMTATASLKTLGVFEAAGGSVQQLREEVQSKLFSDFPRLYFNALTVVPIYQAVNYRFVPLRYRMFWLNGCQLFWNIWVSHRVARQVEPHKKRIPT
eukprot:s1192_g10.t1